MIAKKLFFLLFAFPTWVFGQCFTSPGNPIGGTANMGTLSKGILRGNIFHKYNYADRYLNGDSPSDFIYYKKAFYNYTGSVFAYGITDKLNIETEAGFFENKTVIFSEKFGNQTLANTIHTGYGFSNAVLSLKYNVFTNNKKRFEWTMALGGKVPFRFNPVVENGTPWPEDIQPSTGSFGIIFQSYLIKENSFTGLRFFLLNRIETNVVNNENIKYGNTYVNSLFITKHLWFPWTTGDGIWTAILQLRNEYRNKIILDKGTEYEHIKTASGGTGFYISPQINVTITKTLNFSVMYDYPFYQYYNEIQLSNKHAILFNLTKDIIFNKDIKSSL